MVGKRTAWLIGGTGLVGKSTLKCLRDSADYSLIHMMVRRPMAPAGDGMREHVIEDFSAITPELLSNLAPVHDVYCALGTTIAKAGSQAAFRKVDFEAVVVTARAAKALGATTFAVVSSVGADPRSSNFYLRTKGEMEAALAEIGFESLVIARPSLILGDRQEERRGEKIATVISKVVKPLLVGPLQKYQAIDARDVAAALVNSVLATSAQNKSGALAQAKAPLILHYRELMMASRLSIS